MSGHTEHKADQATEVARSGASAEADDLARALASLELERREREEELRALARLRAMLVGRRSPSPCDRI